MLLFFAILLVPTRAQAHIVNQSYVYFRILQDSINGSIQVRVDDLNQALDLGLERGMTTEELQVYLPDLYAYFRERLEVTSDSGNHPLRFTDEVTTLAVSDGYVIGLGFELLDLPAVPETLNVRFNPIYDVDDTHRSFALIEYDWKGGVHNNESMISLRFGPGDDGPKVLDLSDNSVWKGFWAMISSGMYHIYIGLDHILFLIALLLPAVVYHRRETQPTVGAAGSIALTQQAGWEGSWWQPVDRFRPAFLYVLKIVTFFTIAHTITLSLAALGLVNLPSYLVEALIALSIALAALHNIRPLLKNDGMIIAFVFGLFHGFGFASVLGEVGLRGEFMTWSLLGFNVGVELAQVIIICLVFPVLFVLRKFPLYRYILYGGSAILIVIAMYWFIERLFGINIPVWWIVEWAQGLF